MSIKAAGIQKYIEFPDLRVTRHEVKMPGFANEDDTNVTTETDAQRLRAKLLDPSLSPESSDDLLFSWLLGDDPAKAAFAAGEIKDARGHGIDRVIDLVLALSGKRHEAARLKLQSLLLEPHIVSAAHHQARFARLAREGKWQELDEVRQVLPDSEENGTYNDFSVACVAMAHRDAGNPPEKRSSVSVVLWSNYLIALADQPRRDLLALWLGEHDEGRREFAVRFHAADGDHLPDSVFGLLADAAQSDVFRRQLLRSIREIGTPLSLSQWRSLTLQCPRTFPELFEEIGRALYVLPHHLLGKKFAFSEEQPGGRKEDPRGTDASYASSTSAAQNDPATSDAKSPDSSRPPPEEIGHLQGVDLAKRLREWLVYPPSPEHLTAARNVLKVLTPPGMDSRFLVDLLLRHRGDKENAGKILDTFAEVQPSLSEDQWFDMTRFVFWNQPDLAGRLGEVLRTCAIR